MKLSVITTCYNAENFIEKTIQSVLSQSFTDFEYIIMDGQSKDSTLKIAESFKEAFNNKGIIYKVFSEKDNGLYEGMNHGVAHASGDFINFMNADDVFFDENVLERIFSDNEALNADIIYGDAAEIEYGERYLFLKNFDNIENRMPFSHQSTFARRELLNKYPLNLKYKIAADYDFLINCYLEGYKFYDSNVMVACISKDGISSVDLYNTFLETEQMLCSHGIQRYSDKALKRKLAGLKIKQFGMNYFPDFIKKAIRRMQRLNRGQNNKI